MTEQNPRQTAKERVAELREEINQYERIIENQKQSLPDLPFKTVKVLDSKGHEVPPSDK